MARVPGHRGWRALVLGDGFGPQAPQTGNERQALALATALLKTSSKVSGKSHSSGWNVRTASLAAVQHPMPRLYRPLASESSDAGISRMTGLARKHLPSAMLYPFALFAPPPVVKLPPPFDSPCDQDSTIVISAGECVEEQSLIARDRIVGSKLVQVHLPRKSPYCKFDAIVAADYEFAGDDEDHLNHDAPRKANVITSPLALHDVTPQRLASHAAQQPCEDILALQSPRFALFLGGPGVVRDDFWTDFGASRLSQQLASVAGSDGNVVIVASSRTPDAFAFRLQRQLVSKLGLNRVLYDNGSSRARHLFILATSDAIVISADCLVTVSEAVAAASAPIALVGVTNSTQSERLAKSMVEARRVSLLDSNCLGFRGAVDHHHRAASEPKSFESGDADIDRVAADVWNVILR